MIGELHRRGGSHKAVGLKHVPPKSWLHKWLKRLPMDMLDDIILFTAGKAAYGSFSVDSSHHQFNRYTRIDDSNIEKRANAKGQKTSKGQRWVADTCKHHALISPGGTILASIVTDKDTTDSPVFVKLCNKIPKGNGPALGDSAYCSSDNCDAAIVKGRDPYFEPKKNHAGKGTSSWAKIVRFWKVHPGQFYKIFKTRTTVEAAFSSIKAQFA